MGIDIFHGYGFGTAKPSGFVPVAISTPPARARRWTGLDVRIFCILTLHLKQYHVWTLENFNVIFGPFARRHSL
jgi:hypothetical protein